MFSQIQASHLTCKMVSGVKQHMFDKINSILMHQIDIASDSEKFLNRSSERTMFNGPVRYFAHGLPECQCGINV